MGRNPNLPGGKRILDFEYSRNANQRPDTLSTRTLVVVCLLYAASSEPVAMDCDAIPALVCASIAAMLVSKTTLIPEH
jgi:hypothetical protein